VRPKTIKQEPISTIKGCEVRKCVILAATRRFRTEPSIGRKRLSALKSFVRTIHGEIGRLVF
jgi:hypothetical protein